MTGNTRKSEALFGFKSSSQRACVGGFIAALIAVGTPAIADKTPEPWAQTGALELAAGEGVGPIRFSPDSAQVSASARNAAAVHSARLWSSETGMTLLSLASPFDSLLAHEFTPAGDRVYAHTDTDLRAWTTADGVQSSAFMFDGPHATNDVAFFEDHFLASKQFGGVEFWSGAGVKVTQDGLDAMRPYQDIAITDSGLTYVKSAAFTVHLNLAGFDPAVGDLVDTMGTFGPYALLLATTPSGDKIATYPEVGGDGLSTAPVPMVRIWEDVPAWAPDGTPLTEITGFAGEIVAAEFSSDDMRLLTLSDTGVVSVWEVAGGALFASTSNPGDPVTGAVFTPDGDVVMSLTSGAAHLYDPSGDFILQTFPAPASRIALSPNGQKMITYSIGASPARIWHFTE